MGTDVREWLRQCGTETVRHPGGTLFAHLCRVQERLAGFGHDEDVQAAGLTHAAYSTDGFDLALVFWQDRDRLRDLIGVPAEELVYLYGACDRDRTWERLAETRQVTNRFTGDVHKLTDAQLTPFVDLSIVNELDVFDQTPEILSRNIGYFRKLFTAWEPMASTPVAAEVRKALSRQQRQQPSRPPTQTRR
ncbi:DUF6817 domain-containing protein [Actinoplanes sp. NPDC051861]|uniref:DUF6817 domain-containing protein n=1 Tax=Actinoplanes sp. NPDC051861 TaxID=3155170 RepID=UPI0034209C1A